MRRAVVVLAIALLAATAAPRAASYNKKVTFHPGEVLRFRHFTLESIGMTSPGIPELHLAPSYGYRIRRGSEVTIAKWSTGTGDIGPAEFTVGGRKYWLEVMHSDRYGSLKPDEVVVVPK